MTIYTFYRITHPENDKINYIGSTIDLHRRISNHKYGLNSKKKYNIKLYQYLREYNIKFDDLIFEVLMKCDTNIHLKLENMFINQYNSVENGLNTLNSYLNKNEWYEKNKERLSKTTKAYYLKNRDKIQTRSKEYYEKNKERIKIRDKKYYEKNKENIGKYHKNWQNNSMERMEKYQRERVICDICDKEMSRDSSYRHKKTIHKNKIDN